MSILKERKGEVGRGASVLQIQVVVRAQPDQSVGHVVHQTNVSKCACGQVRYANEWRWDAVDSAASDERWQHLSQHRRGSGVASAPLVATVGGAAVASLDRQGLIDPPTVPHD